MQRLIMTVLVMAFVVAACSGADDSLTDGDTDDAAATEAEAGGDGSGATATVQVGGSTYDFSGATDCSPEGPAGLAIRFDDGDDFVSLNQVGDTILVRALLEGVEYVDTGSPDPPSVSGGTVTWSGELSGDGESYDVQMSFSC